MKNKFVPACTISVATSELYQWESEAVSHKCRTGFIPSMKTRKRGDHACKGVSGATTISKLFL